MFEELQQMKDRINEAKQLLDDPQPELPTWCEAFGTQIQGVVDIWKSEGPAPAKDTKDYILVKVITADACFVKSEEAYELDIEELKLLKEVLSTLKPRVAKH